MQFSGNALRFIEAFLDVCFSPNCVACEKNISSGSLCESCGQFWDVDQADLGLETKMERVRCSLWLTDPMKQIVHKIKYGGRSELLSLFKSDVQNAGQFFSGPLTLIPVPMHPWKWAWRGFNQTEILAKWIKQATGWQYSEGLQKVHLTKAQSLLDRESRLKNLKRSFQWKGDDCPKRVLLVDDILTTGATLERCTEALLDAGAAEVYGWTLFRAFRAS